jgi:hypothetical protein
MAIDTGAAPLVHADLAGNKFSCAGAKSLVGPVMANDALVSLNLKGVKLPIKQLKGSDEVHKLDLSGKGNSLGAASAIVIAKCIEVNGALTKVLASSTAS